MEAGYDVISREKDNFRAVKANLKSLMHQELTSQPIPDASTPQRLSAPALQKPPWPRASTCSTSRFSDTCIIGTETTPQAATGLSSRHEPEPGQPLQPLHGNIGKSGFHGEAAELRAQVWSTTNDSTCGHYVKSQWIDMTSHVPQVVTACQCVKRKFLVRGAWNEGWGTCV